MKKDKLIYWLTTGLISAMMLFSGFGALTAPEVQKAFEHLGFPCYFRVELGVAKILGVIALLIPMVPRTLKEFSYAGFTIVFISAFIAHFSSGDSFCGFLPPLVMLLVLGVSHKYYDKVEGYL